MTIRYFGLVLLLAACAGERADGGTDGETRPLAASGVAFQARLPHGVVARGAFVGESYLLAEIEDGGAYLYHRGDGRRVALEVRASRGRRPRIAWSGVLSGDRVAVYDLYNSQLTVFDTTGAVVRTTSLESSTAMAAPLAVFADGGMLVIRDFMPSPYVQETGAYADTTALIPVTAEAEERGPHMPVMRELRYGALADQDPGDAARATIRRVGAVPAGVFDGRGRYSTQVPLSPRTHVAGAHGWAYLGTSDATEIRVLAPDGTVRGRFGIRDGARSVGPAAQAGLRDSLVGGPESRFRELYERVAFPDRTPHYRQLLADADGRLWVERYPLPGDTAAYWTVYGADGVPAGRVTLPKDVRLLDATSRHLLIAREGGMRGDQLQVVPYAFD